MKIGYASDLHIEFEQLELYNTENADLLILAGDIIISNDLFSKSEKHYLNGREFIHNRSDRYHLFFQQVCEEFKNVIYIFGNHEYYNGDFAIEFDHVKEELSYLKNLYILEKEKFILNDVTFLCGTMWTDFDKKDEYNMGLISRRMNDFQIVSNSNKRMLDDVWTPTFSPYDAYEEHLLFLEFVNTELTKKENKKVVMVTHHCPSKICIPQKYRGYEGAILNPAYFSDLSDLILNNPKISHWVCGHSHKIMNDMIGSTNILMNCRGYKGKEPMADNFELKYFEV